MVQKKRCSSLPMFSGACRSAAAGFRLCPSGSDFSEFSPVCRNVSRSALFAIYNFFDFLTSFFPFFHCRGAFWALSIPDHFHVFLAIRFPTSNFQLHPFVARKMYDFWYCTQVLRYVRGPRTLGDPRYVQNGAIHVPGHVSHSDT